MQIIWVSGPVGHIRTLNVSFKHLVFTVLGFTLVLIVCGALLQLIGFRIAIELNPDFLRKIGNLHSATEIDNLQHFYEGKLQTIQQQVQANNQLVNELQEQNKKLMFLAIPAAMQKEKIVEGASGGPFIPLEMKNQKSIFGSLDGSLSYIKKMNQQLTDQKTKMDQLIHWIEAKPIAIPMPGMPRLSSGFGKRVDPITNAWSEHEGLDFLSAIGTTIYAAGSGLVTFSGWDNSYGQSILINHGDGYVSRYAHASQLLVKEGARVDFHQPIALVGTTGRSTGPHLHVEIIKHGVAVNPAEYLIGLQR